MGTTINDLNNLVTRLDLLDFERSIEELNQKLFERFCERLEKAGVSMGETEQEFYTPPQFGKLIGLDRTTVVRWCQAGKIHATQPGGEGTPWLIPRNEISRLRNDAERLV